MNKIGLWIFALAVIGVTEVHAITQCSVYKMADGKFDVVKAAVERFLSQRSFQATSIDKRGLSNLGADVQSLKITGRGRAGPNGETLLAFGDKNVSGRIAIRGTEANPKIDRVEVILSEGSGPAILHPLVWKRSPSPHYAKDLVFAGAVREASGKISVVVASLAFKEVFGGPQTPVEDLLFMTHEEGRTLVPETYYSPKGREEHQMRLERVSLPPKMERELN